MGKNASSADNQQERLGDYIAGYVDGEGSFHIGIQKSFNVKSGYQLVPEFHVSQNSDRKEILLLIKKTLDCGYIKNNHKQRANDNSKVLVVRNRNDLLTKVIPFFETYPLISKKNQDFNKFSEIVKAMERLEHLKRDDLVRLIKKAFSMNGKGKYRKFNLDQIIKHLESSETTRRSPIGKIG